jgi:hypothetical protein
VKLFISWRLVFNALNRRPLGQRQNWLKYFKFDDRGVVLIPDPVFTESEKRQEGALSKSERTVLSAIAEPKRPRFLY